jgi:hypothetical protein
MIRKEVSSDVSANGTRKPLCTSWIRTWNKDLILLVRWLFVAAILAAGTVLRRNFAHSKCLVAEDKAKEQVYGSDQPGSD